MVCGDAVLDAQPENLKDSVPCARCLHNIPPYLPFGPEILLRIIIPNPFPYSP
jgi:hypothetical protein